MEKTFIYKKFLCTIYQPNSAKYPDWWEYVVEENTDDIHVEFDSLKETYNGMQKLDKKTARESAKSLVDNYYNDEDDMHEFFGEISQ